MQPHANLLVTSILYFVTQTKGSFICSANKKNVEIDSAVSSSVGLPCQFAWNGHPPKGQEVVWQKQQGDIEDLIVHFQNGKDSVEKQSELFFRRTSVTSDWFHRSDATLTLSPISVNDSGVYTCYLMSLPMGPGATTLCSQVTLIVVTSLKKSSEVTDHTMLTLLNSSLVFILVGITVLCVVIIKAWKTLKLKFLGFRRMFRVRTQSQDANQTPV